MTNTTHHTPVIALVGRPNVGKSTLFNRLTKSRNALVADFPGLTRDRQYGRGCVADQHFWVIDTGGIEQQHEAPLARQVVQQVTQAIIEADHVIWLVDAKAGLTAADRELAEQLRRYQHKLTVAANKADRTEAVTAVSEFFALGLGEPIAIAATSGRGVRQLIKQVLGEQPLLAISDPLDSATPDTTRIAIVGRPNVGKSTLINRIIGQERVVVSKLPGTTRDSIDIPFTRDQRSYTLIDTAGIRRRAKVSAAVEKFSILKSLQAIEQAEIIIQLFDASEGITEQDLRLTAVIIESGRALILGFNKWDGLSNNDRTRFKEEVARKLTQVDFARRYTLSALHGTGVGKLYHAIDEAHQAIHQPLSTAKLTRILIEATNNHSPPRAGGRHIRPRYAHVGSRQPLTVVIHGKQCERLPAAYQRYLANCLRKACNLVSVPLQIKLKNDDNPYHN